MRPAQGRFRPHTPQSERENTVAEAKWFGAPFLLVTASWFVDYTVLAIGVLLCATIWLLLHVAGVTGRGSLRLERPTSHCLASSQLFLPSARGRHGIRPWL
jgi:hypothetical protein